MKSEQTLVSCFPKGTPTTTEQYPLNKWSFTIPGKGFSADYCMKPKVSGLSKTPGQAVKVSRLKCNRTQCPNCYEWWISERVFDISVKIESYAFHCGDRPSAITCSEHPDTFKDKDWDYYNKSFRRLYRKLKKLGVNAGYRIFHSSRIEKKYKDRLTKKGYANGSSGHWKGVRDNALELDDWHEYLKLAPHLHVLAFPSYLEANEDYNEHGTFIRKYNTLDSIKDVVGHARYLLTHCGVLSDDDSNEPTQPIGALYGWKPEDYLTPEELHDIKLRVAETMGVRYNDEKGSIEMIEEDEKEEPDIEFHSMYEFLDYSMEQNEFIESYIAGCHDPSIKQYIELIIDRYNRLMSDSSLPDSEQHVFFDDLPAPPDGLLIVYDYGLDDGGISNGN